MKNEGWMRDLAFHYEAVRRSHPEDRLMIVFDIDGTIVDERHPVLSVLKAYDEEHGTRYFHGMLPEDITAPAHRLDDILKGFGMANGIRREISDFCASRLSSRAAVLEAHRPCRGVLDVIRWFQLQERTSIGLNTSRSQDLREDTLRIMNTLGSSYHVKFDDRLLHMNPGVDVHAGKVEGIRRFRAMGYRIVAVIDSERDNLDAICRLDGASDMLLIHSDLMWGAPPSRRGGSASAGCACGLSELIGPKDLPGHVEFAWHGVDDESILRQFLVSPVKWAEVHVRRHPQNGRLVLRRRPYAEVPALPYEPTLNLEDCLCVISEAMRGVKLDLKDPGLTPEVIESLRGAGFTDGCVWFTVGLEEALTGALRPVIDVFPGSVRQCPVDTISRMFFSSPGTARAYVGMLGQAGVGRFSVDWNTPGSREIIVQLQNWGLDVNIYNVPDLESFLQAVLMLPTSITSYFNFPKWFYTGSVEDPLYPSAAAAGSRA